MSGKAGVRLHRAAHLGAKVHSFFLRVGLRKTLPLVAQKKFKLIRLTYVLRIARANRAVKFSGGCLQNCGLENSRRDCKIPLSTVGNGPSAERNAPPWGDLNQA